MRTVEQHIAEILETVRPLAPIELDLLHAHGAVLAEPVTSPVALPQFDNSAMDGYAVRLRDVAEATAESPVTLPVVADIPAGDTSANAIRDGLCARIMTGAPIPAGADTVIPVEWTDGGIARVTIHRCPRKGNAIRRAGEDIDKDTLVLDSGVRLGAGELGVLAAVGRSSVRVHPRPRVAVISTGEELVEPGEPLGSGQLWDSNSYTLTAAAFDIGCAGHRYGFVGDDPAAVMRSIEDALMRADLIVTTGGVSMGAYDAVKEVLSRLGTVRFEQVAMQPGKPQGAGTVGEAGVPILTLPGNPVSAYVSFQLFALPALRLMQGLPPEPLASVHARLTVPVTSPEGRRSYLRATLEYSHEETGAAYTVEPASRQGSHQLSALAGINALVVIPETVTSVPEGSVVEAIKLPHP